MVRDIGFTGILFILEDLLMKISAMIFAAGLGTRLYPLTENKPKALVCYNGTTLLELAIRKMIDSGIREIVVNVHHFSEQIIHFLNHHHFEADIHISEEREQLLDTAGGLKHAEHHFQESDHILLYNVDILSSIDLNKMMKAHIENDSLATLAVKERLTERYFIFDQPTMQLCGWENKKTGEEIIVKPTNQSVEFPFSGIHLVKKKILEEITPNEKISFTPLYLRLAADHKIVGYPHSEDEWMDVGRYENFPPATLQ